jgi:hypothetical protein
MLEPLHSPLCSVDVQQPLQPKPAAVNAGPAPVKRASDGPAEDYTKYNKKAAPEKVRGERAPASPPPPPFPYSFLVCHASEMFKSRLSFVMPRIVKHTAPA